MKIHTSHSKKELLEIVSSFDLNVENKYDLNKSELVISINKAISLKDEIPADDEYFFVENKKELIEYLESPNQSKVLTIKEKNALMLIAKKVIIYCRNGHYLASSGYDSYDDLWFDVKYLEKYGDVPSSRRAVNLMNDDPKRYEKLVPIISKRILKKMEKSNELKRLQQRSLTIKNEKIFLSFD